jgi:hypothetical protein
MRFSALGWVVSAAVVIAVLAVSTSDAQAFNPRYRRLHGGSIHPRTHVRTVRTFSVPTVNRVYYGAPGLHYDLYYHHEFNHWTPWRGLHSHGHYDAVPHIGPHYGW